MSVLCYLADRGYGHPWQIAETYSADEILLFFEESTKLYAKGMLDDLTVNRYAQHADAKGVKKLTASLNKVIDPSKAFLTADEFADKFGAGLRGKES